LPELRRDPVIGRWVIVAEERGKRPSDFATGEPLRPRATFCPFCPGSEFATPHEIRSHRPPGTAPNHPGWSVRVIPNKFPALRVEGQLERAGEGIYDRMNGIGAHEVIIESPRHDATLATLSPGEVEGVLLTYRERIVDLKRDERLRYIIVFKNHGQAAGASLEHPHSQLIALPVVPRNARAELDGARDHYAAKERCIYCDILREEKRDGRRITYENERFLVFCPYASNRAFETWIVPKAHESNYEDMPLASLPHLADALRTTLRKLDRALEHPPYNFMLHSNPLREPASPSYHWHLELVPTLTGVAGFEWGTGFFINPTPPEEAAAFLRRVDV
jgi:UDPglucose--hexose-1-phosphate uridylyltransferase